MSRVRIYLVCGAIDDEGDSWGCNNIVASWDNYFNEKYFPTECPHCSNDLVGKWAFRIVASIEDCGGELEKELGIS